MKLEENENLTSVVETDTGLKQLVVNYIGESLGGTEEDITVEFPEFLMTIAEENFFRGYEQALIDVESSEKTS